MLPFPHEAAYHGQNAGGTCSLEQLNQSRILLKEPVPSLLRGFLDLLKFQEPTWSADRVQLEKQAITNHLGFTVRHNASVSAQAIKQLLVVRVAHHALDQVAFSCGGQHSCARRLADLSLRSSMMTP